MVIALRVCERSTEGSALLFVQVSRSAAVRCVPTGQGVVATCLASCPRRDHVALCPTSMYVCDACSGKVISVAPIPDGDEVSCASYTPDGARIALGFFCCGSSGRGAYALYDALSADLDHYILCRPDEHVERISFGFMHVGVSHDHTIIPSQV